MSAIPKTLFTPMKSLQSARQAALALAQAARGTWGRRTHRATLLKAAALLALGFLSTRLSAELLFEAVELQASGYVSSVGLAMNESGSVAGYVLSPSGNSFPAFWGIDGSVIVAPIVSSQNLSPGGNTLISEDNRVFANYLESNAGVYQTRAISWTPLQGGTITDAPVSATWSDISSNGSVVGLAKQPNYSIYGVSVWDGVNPPTAAYWGTAPNLGTAKILINSSGSFVAPGEVVQGMPRLLYVQRSIGGYSAMAFLETGVFAGINDLGIAAGWVGGQDLGTRRGVVLDPAVGILEYLPVPSGVTATFASGINGNGEVAGTAVQNGKNRAFSWRKSVGGPVTLLPVLVPGDSSSALGLNDAGVTIGTSGDKLVTWQNGIVRSLDSIARLPRGAVLTQFKNYGFKSLKNSGYILVSGTKYGHAATFLLRPLADLNNNGLPDSWENQYGLPAQSNVDSDSDGLTNLEEYRLGTNPLKRDTDDDGMSDLFEVVHQYDPTNPSDGSTDYDLDGLSAAEEASVPDSEPNPRYSLQVISPANGQASDSAVLAYGVNDQGDVVGESGGVAFRLDASGVPENPNYGGLVLLPDIPPLAGYEKLSGAVAAFDINNRRNITGVSSADYVYYGEEESFGAYKDVGVGWRAANSWSSAQELVPESLRYPYGAYGPLGGMGGYGSFRLNEGDLTGGIFMGQQGVYRVFRADVGVPASLVTAPFGVGNFLGQMFDQRGTPSVNASGVLTHGSSNSGFVRWDGVTLSTARVELSSFLGATDRTVVTYDSDTTGKTLLSVDSVPYIWTGTTLQRLGDLGGSVAGAAYSFNSAGDAVGFSATPDGKVHAVLHRAGKTFDLNGLIETSVENFEMVAARSINEHGLIVGYGYIGGLKRGFVLTPLAPVLPPAVGGEVTSSGGYTVHKFRNGGTLKTTVPLLVDVVVVGGGGGGAAEHGGGGGGGGVISATGVNAGVGSFGVVIGNGGVGAAQPVYNGNPGGNSSAFGFVAIGGGHGSSHRNPDDSDNWGGPGGSGGGSGYPIPSQGGTATAGQGFRGNLLNTGSSLYGGGGGGAGGAGQGIVGGAARGTWAGAFAGGGGGGFARGSGGGGGGGDGGGNQGLGESTNGLDGAANSGGGGGGGGNIWGSGGNGGSGVVIVRYVSPPPATGGSVTIAGGYATHTFETGGTFTAKEPLVVDYLVVAGGGGGGSALTGVMDGGGGGGGGVLTGTSFPVAMGSYPVAVGAGGTAGQNGGNSNFSSLVAIGGGHGAHAAWNAQASDGGSGGGQGTPQSIAPANPNPPGHGAYGQGHDGGNGSSGGESDWNGGGGGGAASPGNGINGGAARLVSISGTAAYYGGGGGGGSNTVGGGVPGQNAGAGGVWIPATGTIVSGFPAKEHFGGGGGGGGGSNSASVGGKGGSGIVIVRYPWPPRQPSAPVVTQQPVSITIDVGNTAAFSVEADGFPIPAYQWRKGGVNIPGAVGPTYTIANASLADAGVYSVVVTNSVGIAVSSNASLTVNGAGAPTILSQPVSQSLVVGQPVSFSVVASGYGSLSYQWQKNGSSISGANASSYTIASVVGADAGQYSVIVTSAYGSTASQAVSLTVQGAGGVVTTTTTLTYDPLGRLDTVTSGETMTADFDYDAEGNIKAAK